MYFYEWKNIQTYICTYNIYLRFCVCAHNSGVAEMKKIAFYGHYVGDEKQKSKNQKPKTKTQQLTNAGDNNILIGLLAGQRRCRSGNTAKYRGWAYIQTNRKTDKQANIHANMHIYAGIHVCSYVGYKIFLINVVNIV